MDKDSDEFTDRLNQELDEDERLGPMSDLISHYSDLIEVLEGFGQRDDSEWIMLWRSERGGLSALDRIFDEFFVRQFLSSIPGYVERLKRLSPMTSNKAPCQDINVYLRETTRCCILGHWDASIALSRTTLETAIKHEIKDKLRGLIDPSTDELSYLLRCAEKLRLLDHPHLKMAHEVRLVANSSTPPRDPSHRKPSFGMHWPT